MRSLLLGVWVVAALAAVPDTTRFVSPWNREPKGWDITIAPEREPGPRMIVSGRVLGVDSLPASGVTVYAYHTDAKGWYWKPPDKRTVNRIGGVLRSGPKGQYQLRSIVAGRYEGSGPHIHFEAWGPGVSHRVLAVSLYLETGAPPDSALSAAWQGHIRRASLSDSSPRTAVLAPDSAGGYRCRYDLYLGEMYPTDAKADSFRRAQDLELEKLPRQ